MRYAVVYPKSSWAGNGVVQPPRNSTLSELETMPPYGATIAGNMLQNIACGDFIGVIDEYMIDDRIEDVIENLYSKYRREDMTLFFSAYVFNNDRVVTMAADIKRRYTNVLVVVGGPFAEYFVQNKDVDSVIIGEAEKGIPKYFAKKDHVVIAERADPNEILVDFSVLLRDQPYARGVMNSIRGCKYRTVESGGCVFCSMKETSVKLRNPDLVLKEMAKEAEELKTEWFFDGSDSFVFSKAWLRKYSAVRQSLLSNGYGILRNLKVFAYANASDVMDKEIPELLYECGVRRVFLGIESGDNSVLERMKKYGASVEANHRALELFQGSNIEVRFGIVLGIGEDENTLMNTFNFLRSIRDYNDLRIVSVVLSPVMVLPGSRLYQDMVSNKYKLKESDFGEVLAIDAKVSGGSGITKHEINRLSKIYVESTTCLSYDQLMEWKRKMDDFLVAQNVGIWIFGGY